MTDKPAPSASEGENPSLALGAGNATKHYSGNCPSKQRAAWRYSPAFS
jgi:hypothetical protein